MICLLLESVTDARRFFAEACRTTPAKPVIAAVGGRTGAGRRAAVSHTAALATDDAVRDAALRQAGVVRVRTGLQVLDAARALSGQPMPRGRRVAVVTNSGGTGVELADLLADEGLELPELSGPLQERAAGAAARLRQRAQPGGHDAGLAPVHHRVPGRDRAAGPVRRGRRGRAGAAAARRRRRRSRRRCGTRWRRLRADGVPVPVYVCWVAPRGARPHADLLQEAGVPCFPWPDRTARAAGVAVRCGLRRVTPPRGRGYASGATGHAPPPPPDRPQRSHTAVAAAQRRHVDRVGPGGLLGREAARDLLAGAGIPVVETVWCASAAAAAAAAGRLGYPVVAKVAHPELTHKSDVGGVRLGLVTAAAVRGGRGDLLALADGAAVLVQPQRRGVELVVGGIRDPEFGPVVMAGFGGMLVEARVTSRWRWRRWTRRQATALLRSLRGAAVLRPGCAASPPVDLGPVAA